MALSPTVLIRPCRRQHLQLCHHEHNGDESARDDFRIRQGTRTLGDGGPESLRSPLATGGAVAQSAAEPVVGGSVIIVAFSSLGKESRCRPMGQEQSGHLVPQMYSGRHRNDVCAGRLPLAVFTRSARPDEVLLIALQLQCLQKRRAASLLGTPDAAVPGGVCGFLAAETTAPCNIKLNAATQWPTSFLSRRSREKPVSFW
ncbi:hypothetical protein P154DRAFT_596682 [Amniculicola lignicola CBS 123094]|uniref:Uncharacterized protein n=1 Tax=Amniculicola lignicola CBS 123094 TaxID=1392246 RepID=A0A6A5WKL9_9PLEO|nr:hypothetical protein P154DRAFT_596682 [Amniculicola lignicola CBS 123094]